MLSGNAQAIDSLGYVAAAMVFLCFCMRTMLALRLVAIASNVSFLLYGLAGGLTPILVLHGLLLPLNVIRLIQMRRQVRHVDQDAGIVADEDGFEWLIPLGVRRELPAGEMLFSKGEPADSLFIVIDGEVQVPEVGAVLGPGSIVGEISLFSGDRRRTAGARATSPVILAELTEQRVQELYFDNPNFAYGLIRLVTRRLVEQLKVQERRAEAAASGEAAAIAARDASHRTGLENPV